MIYFSLVCRDPIVGAGFKPALKVRFILSADPSFRGFVGMLWENPVFQNLLNDYSNPFDVCEAYLGLTGKLDQIAPDSSRIR